MFVLQRQLAGHELLVLPQKLLLLTRPPFLPEATPTERAERERDFAREQQQRFIERLIRRTYTRSQNLPALATPTRMRPTFQGEPAEAVVQYYT